MSIRIMLWLVPLGSASLLLYACGFWPKFWRFRIHIGRITAGLVLAGLPFVAALPLRLPQLILLMFVQVWLAICAVRLAAGRLQEPFLRHSTRHAVSLAVAYAALIVLGSLLAGWYLVLALGISLMVAWLFAAQAWWALRHYRVRKPQSLPPLKDLPTVTLAIPARNETHALGECLSAAIASDYPKLEIIVLDDCSQDATSQLIRSFAQSGVRFIQGTEPSDGWLGKNNALRNLAQQASGDYIVFADVDTHLQPQSIGKLVAYTLSHKLAMVSVLARRRDGPSFSTTLWQLKYYWQAVLPITKRRVPVASQCWIIDRDELTRLGGFGAVRQKIMPEGYFARRLFSRDAYRFIVSDDELGITTAKKWSSQADTALRLLYPICKRQPFVVLAACLAVAGILLPFGYAGYAAFAALVFGDMPPYAWMAATAAILYTAGYALITVRANPHAWLLTALCFPLSLIQEIILLLSSMLKYEFGTVDWKSRNVCYPVIAGKYINSKERYDGGKKRRPGAPGAAARS